MRSPRTRVSVLLLLSLVFTSACAVEEPSDRDGLAWPLATAGFPVHTVCGGEQTVPGIDVSQYQGLIDWDALAASGEVAFVYMRVGNGLGTDTRIDRNWPEARRVGLRRGAYQYFRPGMDARAEAEHYLAVLDQYGGYLADDLPPMIDVETSDGASSAAIVAAVRTWVETIEAETGMRPIIYTGSYFWDDNVGSDAFADYHVWTAHYTAAACPLTSSSWDAWTIWQFTSTGSVTGITGNVDVNRFNGSLADLDLWPRCSRYRPIASCLPPDWWCAPLAALTEAGILDSTCQDYLADDTFDRAAWAQLVGVALNLADTDAFELCRLGFSDVAAEASYARYVAALTALDYGDGVAVFAGEGVEPLFEAAAGVSRCEAAFIVAEAWDVPAAPGVALQFSDAGGLPSVCSEAVRSLVGAGLLENTSEPFRGDETASVGEAAALVVAAIAQIGRATPAASAFADPSCAAPDECTDLCAIGERVCDGAALSSCEVGRNECTRWGQPLGCASGTVCEGGACVPGCADPLGCGSSDPGPELEPDTGLGGEPDAGVEGPGLPRFARSEDGIAGGCRIGTGRGPGWSGVLVFVLGLALARGRRGRSGRS